MNKPTNQRMWCCVKYYLRTCAAKGQASDTIRGKYSGLRKFFIWCLEHNIYHVTQINLDVMDGYMEYLNVYRKPLDNKPLCLNQKRNLLTFVKTFIKTIHRKGILETNPLEFIELPGKEYSLPKGLFNETEIEQILDQPLYVGECGFRDKAIMETFYATGIRRTELMHLRFSDINFEANELTITHGKGHRQRIVPISKRALEWILLYWQRYRPILASIGGSDYLFLANSGKQFLPNKLSDLVAKYVKMAGLKRHGACHLFRHATATFMLDNDADIRHVQVMLGHASLSTTQIYTHVSQKKLHAVYARTHPSALSKLALRPR